MDGQTGFQPERSTGFDNDGFKPERSTAFDNEGFGLTSPEPKDSEFNQGGFQAEPKPTEFSQGGFQPVSSGFKDESSESDQPKLTSSGFEPVSSGFQDAPIGQTGFQPQDRDSGFSQGGFQDSSSSGFSQRGFQPDSSGFGQTGFQPDRSSDSTDDDAFKPQPSTAFDSGNTGFQPERSTAFDNEAQQSSSFGQTGFREESS